MIAWSNTIEVYLHRDPVDFRKAINGLSLIVSDVMGHSPFKRALFVFCNKRKTQLKVLYWDDTGFVLWQKRLEKDRFKWPKRLPNETIQITPEQWQWLLRGFDFTAIKPHQRLEFSEVS